MAKFAVKPGGYKTVGTICDIEPEYELANAIVIRACQDYVNYMVLYYRYGIDPVPELSSAQHRKIRQKGSGYRKNITASFYTHIQSYRNYYDSAIRFFDSEWYPLLTQLDKEFLLAKLDKQARELAHAHQDGRARPRKIGRIEK